jgi:hypothetical protein
VIRPRGADSVRIIAFWGVCCSRSLLGCGRGAGHGLTLPPHYRALAPNSRVAARAKSFQTLFHRSLSRSLSRRSTSDLSPPTTQPRRRRLGPSNRRRCSSTAAEAIQQAPWRLRYLHSTIPSAVPLPPPFPPQGTDASKFRGYSLINTIHCKGKQRHLVHRCLQTQSFTGTPPLAPTNPFTSLQSIDLADTPYTFSSLPNRCVS